MELYILRHGKAQDRHSGITSDAGRRLTAQGRAEMNAIASGITSLGISPDVIISSPLVRARETARLVFLACHAAGGRDNNNNSGKDESRSSPDAETIIWPELVPEADIYDTHRRLALMPPDSVVMIVGHEPHLSLLASSMILDGDKEKSAAGYTRSVMSLKKGGLAVIRAQARGQRMHGVLRSLVTPKQLKMCGRRSHK